MSSSSRSRAPCARLADVRRRCADDGWRGRADWCCYAGELAGKPPDALEELGRRLDPILRPDHVALGRRIREHEPARGIGAEALDDLVGIDDVALGLRHLLDRADRHRTAVGELNRAAAVRPSLEAQFSRRDPGAGAVLVSLVVHHALREEAGERLAHSARMAGCGHRAGEEAGVEQVEDRVLDPADVLVDGHEAVDGGGARRRALVPRVGKAQEVPGRGRRTCPSFRSRGAPARHSAGRQRRARWGAGRADCRAGRR